MREIKRDNAVINYRIEGEGDITLLFVHGSYIDQTYWNEQVKYFKDDYKVVTFDLPSHGASGKEREHWSFQGFAADVITVVEELSLKKVILIGHSIAGDINLIAATSRPELFIGFIAVDFFKNAATPLSPEYRKQADTILENLKKDFANTNEQYVRMALVTPQTPQEIINRVINDYRNAYEPMGKETMPQIFEVYSTEQKLLPRLTFKLYLVNVDYMPTNEEPLKQYAKNGYEVLGIKGTCHYPMLENPDALNKSLQQVIQQISRDSLINQTS
jgi:sigma-B regulation protein RsbQ